MSKSLKLTLSATAIKQAVKADTHITGLIDKSADMVKNASLAFNEQAGDETYHEAKLYRTMRGALSKLEASMVEYVETSVSDASITDNLTAQSTSFDVELIVGDRLTAAFATPMAHLAEEYIINAMLYYWWQSIKPTLAKDYLNFANDNILDIRRCLAKSAPTSSASSYDDISGSVFTLLPKYNAEDQAAACYAYIRSKVYNYNNPVVEIYRLNDDLVVAVDDGGGALSGNLCVYDEVLERVVMVPEDVSNLQRDVAAIQNEAIALLAGIGVTAIADHSIQPYDNISGITVTRRLN